MTTTPPTPLPAIFATPRRFLDTAELVSVLRCVIAARPRNAHLLSIGKDGWLNLGAADALLTAIRTDAASLPYMQHFPKPPFNAGAFERLLDGDKNAAKSIALSAGDDRLLLWLASVWAHDAAGSAKGPTSARQMYLHIARAIPHADLSAGLVTEVRKAIADAVHDVTVPAAARWFADPAKLTTLEQRTTREVKRNSEAAERKRPLHANPWTWRTK